MEHNDSNLKPRDRTIAREIHEMTYWKHSLGVSESVVRSAIAKVGTNRARVERELKRSNEIAGRT
jgi:hypothetical protein